MLHVGLVFACCWSAIAGSTNSKEAGAASEANNYGAYVQKVAAVAKDAGDVLSAYDYLAVRSFEELTEANAINPNFCIRFLSESDKAPNQRFIAILSMYRLGVHEYVVFVQRMVQLRDQGLVSADELKRSLFPRLSSAIVEHYADSDVQSMLKDVITRDDISPSMKSVIRSVLSGEALEQQRKFDQECCSKNDKP
jgi:hypothetical protein